MSHRTTCRFHLSRLLFAALGVATAADAPAQTWQELGPAPLLDEGISMTGRVSALALSPTRPDRYFLAGASAGVWRSNNGGEAWSPRTDGLPTLAIGALALDPGDENVIYAGSGEANYAFHSLYGLGLYKSTDGGSTWQVLAADTFAGRTFSELAVTQNAVWAAVSRAGGTADGFEGAREHAQRSGMMGLFRSLDGGVSWERLSRGLPQLPASDVDVDPRDAQRIYVSFGDGFGHPQNGIYRSTDGGTSFRKITTELDFSTLGRISLAIAPRDPRRLYAILTNAANRGSNGGFSPDGDTTFGIYRSTDGGDHWTLIRVGNFQGEQGIYNATVVVDPQDPETFFVGGVQLLRSRDGGASFSNVTPPHVDLHDLEFDAAGRLVVATDGGVYRSEDRGDSWVSRNNGLGLVQLYAGLSLHPTAPDVLLGGTQDNGTQLRTGGGREWVSVFGGDGGYTAISQTQPNTLFVEFQGTANLYRSTDGGLTFTVSANGIDAADRNCFLPPIVFDPQNPARLLWATHRIYESTNTGASWRALSGDLTAGGRAAVRALVIAPSNPRTVYATTNDQRLLVSEDGGATWRLARENLSGWPRVMRQLAVDPADDRVAYAAISRFGGERVLETQDRGHTWNSIGAGLPNAPTNTVAVYRQAGQRLIFAGLDTGVYLSRNGGQTWSEYGSNLPQAPVQDLVVDPGRNRLIASTLGRGVWSIALPDSGGGGGGGCPLPPGHGNFCRDCAPCTHGQGDCDSDRDCTAGLTCVQDVGAQFGFGAGIDVCVGAGGGGGGNCPLPAGHGNFCRDCGPCGQGQGDCDSDSDCTGGLTCVQDVGAQFGFGPGIDVCTTAGGGTSCPLRAGHPDYCRDCGPCAAGQGDCDSDSDCRSGLHCIDNIGAQFGFGPGIDVCR